MLLWTFLYRFYVNMCFHFPWVTTEEGNCWVMFNILRNSHAVSQRSCIILHSHQQCEGTAALHTLAHTCYCQSSSWQPPHQGWSAIPWVHNFNVVTLKATLHFKLAFVYSVGKESRFSLLYCLKTFLYPLSCLSTFINIQWPVNIRIYLCAVSSLPLICVSVPRPNMVLITVALGKFWNWEMWIFELSSFPRLFWIFQVACISLR